MSSAAKTLALLSYFSADRPELGLSEFCKIAGRDKATTYRHLQVLEDTGFIEKNALTKQYRLGPAILNLAHMREITVPRQASAEMALRVLADKTGETAHVSVLSGETLYPLLARESPRHATRAIVDLETLPLHATASGACALAFGPATLTDVARRNLTKFTKHTPTNRKRLDAIIKEARETGFGHSHRGFQEDIESVAAPLFDQTDRFAGAVSVACVATRFSADAKRTIKKCLIQASSEISRNWGGTIPADIEALWSGPSDISRTLESAS